MDFTLEELNTIEYALLDRASKMFLDYVAYKKSGNKEAMLDCLAENKKANELRKRIHNEQSKIAISAMTDDIAKIVREKGEQDGNVYRIWLSDLNGVCNISGHTDVMCAHLGEDGILTFQLNTPDDQSSIFVYLEELPFAVAVEIIDKINKTMA